MSNDSPAAIIFNKDGYEVSIKNENTILSNQSGFIVSGTDGYSSKFIAVDSTGKLITTGSGVAGSPSSGISTIQGISNGTPVPVHLEVNPIYSTVNSTNLPLIANSQFIGLSEDVSNIVSIDVSILSDKISAPAGLVFEWSQDNILFGYSESFTIQSNIGQFFSLAPRARYFRIRYLNGIQDQTSFSLTTSYYTVNRSTYVQNLNTDISAEKAVDVVRAVLAGQRAGSTGISYTNLQATSSGLLRVSADTVVFPPAGIATVVQKRNSGPISTQNISVTLTLNTKVNNTLFVIVQQGQGTFGATYTLSDSQSNKYTKIGGVNAATIGSIDIWSATISAASSCTIQAINFNNITIASLQAYEVSGLVIVGTLVDKLGANVGINTTSLSVGPQVTGHDGEFCISSFVASGSAIITPGSGWTSDFSAASFGCFSQVQTTAGSITGTATAASNINYLGLIATFLPAEVSKPLATDTVGKLITKSQIQTDDGYGIVFGQTTMVNSLPVVVSSNQSTIPIKYNELATFNAIATNIVTDQNKSLFSILNNSLLTLRIEEIYLINVKTVNVTGVMGIFEVRRITSHSSGTLITNIETYETSDILDSSITVRTGSIVGGESSNLLWRNIFSTDELNIKNLDSENNQHVFQTMFPIYVKKTNNTKNITLKNNEGLTVKFVTNSATGMFDVFCTFTQE